MAIEIRKPTFQSLKNIVIDLHKNRKLVYKKNNVSIYACNFLDNKSRFYIFKKKKKNFFIKIIKSNNLKIKEDIRISKFLKNKKVNVPKIYENTHFLPFFKRYLKPKETIVCYDLLEKMSIIREGDFFNLGKSLNFFHENMSHYNRKRIIKQNTIKRIKILKINLKLFISKSHKDELLKKIKKILVKEKNIFEQIDKWDFNCITHGDLVPSNLVKSKKKLYFIDFEDTSYSYFVKELDISLIIERLILYNNKNNINKKKLLIKNLLNGYRNNNNKKFFKSIYLASVFNNIKSILSILNNYDANKKFVILELKKFIYLYNLINRNKKLLENFKNF